MLQETYYKLLRTYTTDDNAIQEQWMSVVEHHTHKQRHYHNLQHLSHLLDELMPIQGQFHSVDAVLLAMYYHDFIYKVTQSDNETQSAECAKQALQKLNVPASIIDQCINHILATSGHRMSENNDTNLFTDADLSILGYDWEIYAAYAANVRKEYAQYPDILYKPERKKC